MNVILSNRTNGIITCDAHSHRYWELILTVGGSGKTIFEDRTFDVKNGCLVIVPPGVSHSHISEQGFSDIYVQVENVYYTFYEPVLVVDSSNMLLTLFNMIFMNYIKNDVGYKNINARLIEAVFEYVNLLKNVDCKHEFVWTFREILTKNLSNSSFDIKTAAEKLGMSFDYMRHCFKNELDLTPLEYLTSIRINHAKNLLKNNSNYRISEIASICGFEDQYYFSKTFKKMVGVSPREYRKVL